MSLSAAAFSQTEVQQLFPCRNDSSNAVPGCVAIAYGNGQYAEAVVDTSFCDGDNLLVKYIAANSFLGISQGDSIYQDTLYGACSSSWGGDGIFDVSNDNKSDTVTSGFEAYIFDSLHFTFDSPTNIDTSVLQLNYEGISYYPSDNSPDEFYIRQYNYLRTILNNEIRLDDATEFENKTGLYRFYSFDFTDAVSLFVRALKNDSELELSMRTSGNIDRTVAVRADYSSEDFQFINDDDLVFFSTDLSGDGDVYFPQYNGLDKVITSQTNKYVSMIDTTNGQMFLIHPDSIGGAGGGGSADGNDFLTDLNITSGSSGTNSRTLQGVVSNQPNPSVAINVADADSSLTNELQDLSIDSTVSNGIFREFTISITDGNSVTFRDSIGSGGGGGSDGFLKLDSLVNKTSGSTERITLHFRDETDVQDSLFTEFTDDTGAGGTDDQTLSIDSTATSYDLTIESGNTVSWIKSSDDQNIANSSFNTGNGSLQIGIENGSSQVVNLDGRYLTTELDGDATNEFQTMSIDSVGRKFTLTLTDGNSVSWIDSIGEAGSTDGNDFLTVVTDSEPTDTTITLDFTVPNQSNPTVTFNIADPDADPENEIQHLNAVDRTFGAKIDMTSTTNDVLLVQYNGIVIDRPALTDSITFKIHQDSITSWSDNGLQTLSWNAGTGGNDEITLSDGGGTVTITDNVNDADASATNEIQSLVVSPIANGARAAITDDPEAIDFYGLDGLIFDDSTNSIIKLEIHADSIAAWSNPPEKKDTIYISLNHTHWNDTIQITYSDDYFVVPPSMDGWRIKEQSLSTFGNADGNVSTGYAVQTSVGENYNPVTITSGTQQTTETFSFGQTLSEGDFIRVKTTTTGSDTEGLSMTLMIAEP